MWRRKAGRGSAKLLPQRSWSILPLVAPAFLQLRYEQVDYLLETLRHRRCCEVETVDPGFFNPGLELVGNGLGGSDNDGTVASQSDEVGNLSNRPRLLGITSRECPDGRLNGVALLIFEVRLQLERAEINACPARHESEGADLGGDIEVLASKSRGPCICLAHNHGQLREYRHTEGITSRRAQGRAYACNLAGWWDWMRAAMNPPKPAGVVSRRRAKSNAASRIRRITALSVGWGNPHCFLGQSSNFARSCPEAYRSPVPGPSDGDDSSGDKWL